MVAIHISSFPEYKIYVLLNKDYLKFLIHSSMKKLACKNYFELSLWINKNSKTKFNGGDIKYWLEGQRLDKRTGKIHPKFMSLWLILKLVKLCKHNLKDLDKNVISYRSGGKGLIINKPILPIKITPELNSIIIHLFGDGAAGDFTPSYTQKNKESFDNFIKKLENCFGELEKSIYFTQGKYQIKFPKAISDIISEHYFIKSFHSFGSRIPVMISKSNKNSKLACILAFIVDEGGIRDVISLYSKNIKLLRGVRELVLDCNYSCSTINSHIKSGTYSFNISNKDINKLEEDINELIKEFPTCSLSSKKKQLDFIINRRKSKNPRNKKFTEKVILETLKKGQFTARELSELKNYAYCTIIHTLGDLEKKNMVKRMEKVGKIYRWMLIDSN